MEATESNHRAGGRRAADLIRSRDPDHYRKMGSKGGKRTQQLYAGKLGFAADRELASLAGKKGGAISRRPKSDKPKVARPKTRERTGVLERRIHIGKVRRVAATALRQKGYSYRDIAEALGLKSPHSIGLYLIEDDHADQ